MRDVLVFYGADGGPLYHVDERAVLRAERDVISRSGRTGRAARSPGGVSCVTCSQASYHRAP